MTEEPAETPLPFLGSYTTSSASQRMPPAWVSTGDPLRDLKEPENGIDGIWMTESTGALRTRLVALIHSAREVVCLSSFILADQTVHRAILEAVRHQIRVYVMTATEQKLLKGQDRGDEFSEKVLADHIQLLNDLALRTLLRSGEDLHAKYVLVDPNTPGTRGIIFTCNLSTEGLTRNPEVAVEVTGEEARDLFRLFLWGFWKQSKRELLEVGKITGTKPYQPPNLTGPKLLPCTVEGSTRLKIELMRLIRESSRELWVTSWKFLPTHESVKALEDAARRGVRVRVLTSIRPSPEHMEALVNLSKAGIQVKGLRYLHAKGVISDTSGGPEALVMSANFDAHGLEGGYEAGVRLVGPRLKALQTVFSWWWETASHSLEVEKTLGEIPSGAVRLYQSGAFEEVTVADQHDMDLGTLTAPSTSEMQTTRPGKFPLPEMRGARVYYKSFHYTWKVLPPRSP